MIDFKPSYKYFNSPPNSLNTFLPSPTIDNKKSIELGVFNDHRFAFYFWAKWKEKNVTVPDLITFDWHQDLAYPENIEKEWLVQLDLNNLFDVSFYSWAKLNPLNDNHIASAAYLNLIGDIYVVCKQKNRHDVNLKEFRDVSGKIHQIKIFENSEHLYEALGNCENQKLYLDIDLDYFTIENSTSNDKQFFTYMKDKEIKKVFDPYSILMNWIFERLCGITIAMEPEHTGGISKALKYYSLLEKLWFNGSAFKSKTIWKHLKES